jgi:hypothetical protein
MKSLLYQGFGIKGYRYLRTRYEKGETVFELEPEKEPEVPARQKLRRHGYRWRTVPSVSIGLKAVVISGFGFFVVLVFISSAFVCNRVRRLPDADGSGRYPFLGVTMPAFDSSGTHAAHRGPHSLEARPNFD